jgi:hypothetical protein
VGKKPKTARQPATAARAPKTTVDVAESQHSTPLFCFRHVDRATSGTYVFKPSDEHANLILAFICEMSRLTWAQICAQTTGGKKAYRKHHPMPIAVLESEPQKDLERSKLHETFGDEMFRFRLGNKRRLWGFRRGRTFHVVWWDWDHDVYPTDK